jgi:hypothetical protein
LVDTYPLREKEVTMSDRRERWSRREFVGGLTLAGAAGLLSLHPEPVAAEPPSETPRIRLTQFPDVRAATPLIVANDFLRAEGFAELQGTDWRFLNELKKELKG